MDFSRFKDTFNNVWLVSSEDSQPPLDVCYTVFWGFMVGFASGIVIGVFRLATNRAYAFSLKITGGHDISIIAAFCIFSTLAALITGLLIRNRAIRFGGEDWIRQALAQGQKHSWLKILLPKFLGSSLVMAFGMSVGREGPSIQMGAATALGLKNFEPRQSLERRFFILGGCAAGLAAAFSAPFSGICYVYEIMKEKIDSVLLTFLLAGSFGVYVSVTQICGLDVLLPFGSPAIPSPRQFWLLLPLGILGGLTGVAYNYLLRGSITLYASQKWFALPFRPLLAFWGAAIMLFFFPGITGEGLNIFPAMQGGHIFVGYLCFFLVVKLVFTAYCYGSGIPAGQMVPMICVGGVSGGIYGQILMAAGWMPPEMLPGFIVMGMAASFAAAERAPVTALVLVLEMTGAWSTLASMLPVVAIGAFCGRLAKVRNV